MSSDQTFQIPMSNWYPRFLAWLFALIGFVLSCVAVQSCIFFKQETLFQGQQNPIINYWGLYRYASQGTYCVSIALLEDTQDNTLPNAFEVDAPWKAAKAAGAAAPFFGGIATVMLTMQVCRPMSKFKWIFTSILLLIALVLQGATFLVLLTDECDQSGDDKKNNTARKCSLEEGANQAIAAMVFYFIAIITICRTPPPEESLFQFKATSEGASAAGSTVDGTTVPPDQDTGAYAPGTSSRGRGGHHSSGGKYGEA
mmetsp:Transcript_13070/g.18501  ORF Transcript_13070/g.18501 Transcript_13070/m.18501 type:complete len:256 (-) Transcript_13070:293-1060(-)